jgi:Zn-dependent protease with chaperone function/uncharacterized tellurite resistance protein B-like protein
MSTQFFQRQENARTNTSWLVALFIIAVIGIVGSAFLFGFILTQAAGLDTVEGKQGGIDPLALGGIFGCLAGAVIVLGSLYQVLALRAGGGSSVAESIGGKPLIADTATTEEKRLLNVVEEMAIASGTPVPPVYLLDEPGINAFAAGYRPSDAVIGVTRGAIENLNREQLQGVIAHEFSHVLNGDMRINIRMIGILHGILLLSLLGRMLFHSIRFMGTGRSSRDGKGQAGIVVILIVSGIALMILGIFGSFIGGLIKAAVCRQREYLADASAVQFTRNPNGIGGALKRIASIAAHGNIGHPNASVASHMFFSQGVFEGLTGLMATHPPINKRIMAIDPTWDGNFETSLNSSIAAATSGSATRSGVAMGFAAAPSAANDLVKPKLVREAVEHVGEPEESHRIYSASLLASMDGELRAAAGDPFSARALVFALLLDRDQEIASKQLSHLRENIESRVVTLTERLAPRVYNAPEAMRLPMVDLALPMLRRMSMQQYQQFTLAFDSLVQADQRLSIFEWTLAQVLRRNLRAQYTTTSEVRTLYTSLAKLSREVSLMLSMLARVGHDEQWVQEIFNMAAARLPQVAIELLPTKDCTFANLDTALRTLRRASERCRGDLLDACSICVSADGIVRIREVELLRGIADLLECPMPPLVETINSPA